MPSILRALVLWHCSPVDQFHLWKCPDTLVSRPGHIARRDDIRRGFTGEATVKRWCIVSRRGNDVCWINQWMGLHVYLLRHTSREGHWKLFEVGANKSGIYVLEMGMSSPSRGGGGSAKAPSAESRWKWVLCILSSVKSSEANPLPLFHFSSTLFHSCDLLAVCMQLKSTGRRLINTCALNPTPMFQVASFQEILGKWHVQLSPRRAILHNKMHRSSPWLRPRCRALLRRL